MLEEKLEKWEKELARLIKGIKEAGEKENRGMIDFLYPKMQQVTEFVNDLKECISK